MLLSCTVFLLEHLRIRLIIIIIMIIVITYHYHTDRQLSGAHTLRPTFYNKMYQEWKWNVALVSNNNNNNKKIQNVKSVKLLYLTSGLVKKSISVFFSTYLYNRNSYMLYFTSLCSCLVLSNIGKKKQERKCFFCNVAWRSDNQCVVPKIDICFFFYSFF